MKQIFINNFPNGSQENPNLGVSNMVGFDIYSKKGVLKLAKKSSIVFTNFTAAPTFMDTSEGGNYIWAQCEDKSVLYSADGGATWTATDLTTMTDTGHGNGLIFFQNYMFAFTDAKIYYWQDTVGTTGGNPTAGAWVDWGKSIQSFGTDPIPNLHFPYLYPNNRGVYFGNGAYANAGSSTIGFIGQVSNTLFNPAGVSGTDYLYNGSILSLPTYTWTVGSINFLPPTNLAIAVNQFNQPQQGSDLITWDTISNNKFNPPLRIYGNVYNASATISAGIKQLVNRNQVLYAISGGNHAIYETNGSSYNLVHDLSLFSNIRNVVGNETDKPVFFNSYPSAICVSGNKLYTGVSPFLNTTNYPSSTPNTGIFPVGVWSISFNPTEFQGQFGSTSIQCEFSIPNFIANGITTSPTSPQGANDFAKITCVKLIPQVSTSTGQLAIGFGWKEGANSAFYGIAIVDLFNYITDYTNTALESELFEIGTALIPQTVSNIEINLAKKLLTGQNIFLDYRTGLDQSWTAISYEGASSIAGDGTTSSYKYTKNQIGATQFIQLRIRANTGSANPTSTPEIRSITIQ